MYTRPTKKEKQQYIQLQKWRSLYKHGLLDKSIVDSFVKNNVLFWLQSNNLENQSANKCIRLCEFINQSKNPPVQKSRDPKERSLALFLQNKRQAASGKGGHKIYASDLDVLKRYNMPNLFNETIESRSNQTCVELCQFIIKNGKPPSTISKNHEEKRLSLFLQTKRKAALGKGTSKLYQSDIEILKRYNMEDLFNETPELRSNQTCVELCQFIIKNGKSPIQQSTNDEEKRLALFLQTKRKAAIGNVKYKIYQSDIEILKRYNMSDLFNKIDLEKKSNDTCIRLCEFITESRKLPNRNSKNHEEKNLGSFLSTKRKSASGKGTAKLYQSDIDIIISYNLPDLFKTRGA